MDLRAWASTIGKFDHLTWVGKDISIALVKLEVQKLLKEVDDATSR